MQARVTDFLNPKTGFLPEDGRTESELQTENERLNLQLNQMRLRVLELERAADTDPLVPVYNRRAFIREVEKARTVMARYDIESSVIFFDLNNFKSINDRFGHGIGDEFLRKTGMALLENVRSCDLVARLGGDEFGVLLFKSNMVETKAKAASLACYIAQQHIIMPTGNIHISTAWGAAPCACDDTAEQILARADRAMFKAKRETT
jgi:diguanylate cyclase (GGDEF)-like protein